MNKRISRLVTIVLIALAVLQLGAAALAAEDGGYEYTIRIYAGNEGATIAGQQEYSFQAGYGEFIDVSGMLSPGIGEELPGGKYYVRGIRKSGLDNNEAGQVIDVQEDADYVVAYGIKGELVKYTVHFVIGSEEGPELASPQEYFGNVGDKPVAAYLYFDGYEPNALKLTGTLSDNEAANHWYFIYTPVVQATPVPAPTPVILTEGETGEEGGEAAAGEAGEAGEEAGAPAEEAAAPEEINPEEVPLNNGPREIIDLDEEDTPLGNTPEKEPTPIQQERQENRTKMFIAIGLLVLALAAVGTVIVMALRKRKSAR